VSGQFHATVALPPGKEARVPIGWEAGWGPEPVGTRWWTEKLPAPARNRTSPPWKFSGRSEGSIEKFQSGQAISWPWLLPEYESRASPPVAACLIWSQITLLMVYFVTCPQQHRLFSVMGYD